MKIKFLLKKTFQHVEVSVKMNILYLNIIFL